VKNLELSKVEIAIEKGDTRPAILLQETDGADFFRLKFPLRRKSDEVHLKNVKGFRLFGCHFCGERSADNAEDKPHNDHRLTSIPFFRISGPRSRWMMAVSMSAMPRIGEGALSRFFDEL
jgi:hypothetical protein